MAGNSDAAAPRFAEFVRDLCEPNATHLSPQRIAKRLNLQIQGLAERARVHRNTVARAPDSEVLQGYLRNVVRVLSAAFVANGGDLVQAIAWYRNQPIPDLRHKTADELVSEGRTGAVVAYLESIGSGYLG